MLVDIFETDNSPSIKSDIAFFILISKSSSLKHIPSDSSFFLIEISDKLNSSDTSLSVHFFEIFCSIKSITLLQNVVAAENNTKLNMSCSMPDVLQKNINDMILSCSLLALIISSKDSFIHSSASKHTIFFISDKDDVESIEL